MMIVINNVELTADKNGFYNLDTFYQALNTEEFIKRSTFAGRERIRPIRYLESDSAKSITIALLSMNKSAYRVDSLPTGNVFVCKELLIDYARYSSTKLFIDLINQIFSNNPVETFGFKATSSDFENVLSLSKKLKFFGKRFNKSAKSLQI